MIRHRRTLAVIACLAMHLSLHAQTPATSPVPAPFATAKTLFLGYAGGGGGVPSDMNAREVSEILYNTVWRVLNAHSGYIITINPNEADLITSVSIHPEFAPVFAGNSSETVVLRLSIVDAKTHALLWNIDEPLDSAFRKRSFNVQLDKAAAKLTVDLKALAAGKLP